MCKTLQKKPIHERTQEIIEKREKKLQYLKNNKNYNKRVINKNNAKNKKANNSMDNINSPKKRKRKEYIINEKTKNKKMNRREMSDYYERQCIWKNNLEKKNEMEGKYKNKRKENEFEGYFHPHISQGSIEIINAKNETIDNYGYQVNDNNYNNNNYYYADNEIYPNNMNYGKNVFDRLYEDNYIYEMRKNENKNKILCSFQPFTNKNKYRQIQPKYNDINNKARKKKNKK